MTQTEYEQKRRECWEEFCESDKPYDVEPAFDFAFDRAFALGKQVEIITQEEIEKAAMGYILNRHKAKHNAKNDEEAFLSDFDNTLKAWDAFDMAQAYEDGANFALGKQEKDADTVIQGWVARDQDGYISLFKDKPTRDTCDKDDIPYGFWDEANSNHLELPITSFPDLTWESDPEPVEIIIKRKKRNL